jgi:hypothetical protein
LLQAELLAPAVAGTVNVLKACSEANVKRVVVVSSLSAVLVNPSWPEGKAMDEGCWSDIEVCRNTEVTKNFQTLFIPVLKIPYSKPLMPLTFTPPIEVAHCTHLGIFIFLAFFFFIVCCKL